MSPHLGTHAPLQRGRHKNRKTKRGRIYFLVRKGDGRVPTLVEENQPIFTRGRFGRSMDACERCFQRGFLETSRG